MLILELTENAAEALGFALGRTIRELRKTADIPLYHGGPSTLAELRALREQLENAEAARKEAENAADAAAAAIVVEHFTGEGAL